MYPIDNYQLTCQFNKKNERELFNIPAKFFSNYLEIPAKFFSN
jgi:hypothetical protein